MLTSLMRSSDAGRTQVRALPFGDGTLPQPAADVLRRWRATPTAYLGGLGKRHWLVQRNGERLVLLASAVDLEYARALQSRDLGRKVQAAIDQRPLDEDALGRLTYLKNDSIKLISPDGPHSAPMRKCHNRIRHNYFAARRPGNQRGAHYRPGGRASAQRRFSS
jgi:hypothetical protein